MWSQEPHPSPSFIQLAQEEESSLCLAARQCNLMYGKYIPSRTSCLHYCPFVEKHAEGSLTYKVCTAHRPSHLHPDTVVRGKLAGL